jgi:putative endonuclease
MPGWIGKLLGNRGERLAARFLRRQGYKILARQYSNRFGEIDLVALDGESIVFVEVKTRRSGSAGHPVEAVTHVKQSKLTRAALAFLKRHRLLERSARFDVVAILWPKGAKHPEIDHYRNAFTPVGFGQMYS